jgi:hypothetical protein
VAWCRPWDARATGTSIPACRPATRSTTPGRGEDTAFDDRALRPGRLRPPIWFQQVPEAKAGKNRLHLDLYRTGRDNALPMQRQIEIVEATAAELIGLGASMERRTQHDDPKDPTCFPVMHDPEGNEFCVG